MNPSPNVIDYVRSHVTDWTLSDAVLAAALNAATAPNPATVAPQIPKPFDFGTVFGLLSPASVAAIRDTATAVDLIAKVNQGDRTGVLHWVGALLADPPKILDTEAAAVAGLMTATIADPAWSATVPAPFVAVGRVLDAGDIAASRPEN